MKITEIIQEAHHSITKTTKIGPWTVQIDSHALVSIAHKGVKLSDFTNIVTYSCLAPDIYQQVPVGKGVYFQDVNTLVSIYVTRVSDDTLRVETVLPPSQKPKPPFYRRPVPSSDRQDSQVEKTLQAMQAKTQALGRDAVSQELERITPAMNNLNREQRRRLQKMSRRAV